ncbi:MAG TPA: T9SS type A sorting domain-containing protein [bacterium]|jgi:plastocyanin
MLHRLRWVFACLAAVLIAMPALAAIDSVVVQNFSFTPANLTINEGDTVVWHNISGFHNVHHLGGLFGNTAASAPWFYQFVFSGVGDSTFHYECQIHPTLMQGTITVQGTSDAPPPRQAANASEFRLAQNYPNPFNSQTNIEFTVPTDANIRLTVMDVLGQTVRQVFTGRVSAGQHTVPFNADGLTSGIYFYRLEAPGAMIVRTMHFIK